MRSPLRFLFGLAALAALSARADFVHGDSDASDTPANVRVDVVVDMTPAGRKVAHPTRDKPAYYLPFFSGYKEEGGILTFYQRKPPPTALVQRLLVRALADQGYLIFTPQFHPSLVFLISWGYMAPQYPGNTVKLQVGSATGTLSVNQMTNQAQMLALVGGQEPDGDPKLAFNSQTEHGSRMDEVIEAADVPRYYLLVSALDYKDFTRHRITGLWRAHVSVSYWGHYLDETLPALITAGAPLFGLETNGPQMIEAQTVRVARVEAGEPVLKGYEVPPPAPPAKK